jgi:hypothetical protein
MEMNNPGIFFVSLIQRVAVYLKTEAKSHISTENSSQSHPHKNNDVLNEK